jgi:hypothetical protein
MARVFMAFKFWESKNRKQKRSQKESLLPYKDLLELDKDGKPMFKLNADACRSCIIAANNSDEPAVKIPAGEARILINRTMISWKDYIVESCLAGGLGGAALTALSVGTNGVKEGIITLAGAVIGAALYFGLAVFNFRSENSNERFANQLNALGPAIRERMKAE